MVRMYQWLRSLATTITTALRAVDNHSTIRTETTIRQQTAVLWRSGQALEVCPLCGSSLAISQHADGTLPAHKDPVAEALCPGAPNDTARKRTAKELL